MHTNRLKAAVESATPRSLQPTLRPSPAPVTHDAHPSAPPVTGDACLACKSVYNYPLARWDDMPLSVLGLPRSAAEARTMRGFVLDVRQCASCGHVFHADFHYDHIPYRNGSNLVYNEGASWKAYQDELAAEWLSSYELAGKRVVEIGCGEGLFLERLQRAGTHCIGFEPGPDAARASAKGIECYAEYFQGSRLYDLNADAIVCRHVIEHLADPLDFLDDIAIACCSADISPYFLAEVPSIEKALSQGRINDFLYEHVSNFTCNSFATLFERAGFNVLDLRLRHDDEVITLVAKPRLGSTQREVRARAARFKMEALEKVQQTQRTLEAWRVAGHRVALWGGTGKGAALINMVGITPDLVATVIDSDERKAGGFVPGTGHEIHPPSYLDENPVDRILICTNWRARDIEHEIREVRGLDAELFVLHERGLVRLTDDLTL